MKSSRQKKWLLCQQIAELQSWGHSAAGLNFSDVRILRLLINYLLSGRKEDRNCIKLCITTLGSKEKVIIKCERRLLATFVCTGEIPAQRPVA